MTSTRNIKVWVCVACFAASLAAPAPQPTLTLDIIDMAAISRMSPQQLEKLAEGLAMEEIMRTKRSSAAEALTSAASSVVSKASSGLQSKVGFLSQASAGVTSFIASASSKTGHTDEHQGYSYEPQSEKIDFLGLKKSILYTLFQAVKAITGGVTILKGQLIKGGGALASTLGKVIKVKGEAVSNLGKKIVSSAALSHKPSSSHASYGPPPAHVEYAPAHVPTGYGAPTAPAHYSAPSAPTGFGSHKYPGHLDGRGKLNGVHAGLVILTPLGDDAPSETLITAHSGHTPIEPHPSLLNNVFSAIKNVFTAAPASHAEDYLSHPPPPPIHSSYKPMTWGAVDSYGLPAAADAYTHYDPHNPHPPFDYASAKHSVVPPKPPVPISHGLTPDKVKKINHNLEKLNAYLHHTQRSSEEVPKFNLDAYKDMLTGKFQFPTSVITDNEIGVLPAELLPDSTTTTDKPTTTTTVHTTTKEPEEKKRDKKDVKYFLRGNKIVMHG